jgi:P-type Cu+ transporter
VLDKTGTLTVGRPAVRGIDPHGDLDTEGLLRLAAAAEAASEHPLARAIVAAAADRGLELPDAGAFASVTGFGVTAWVAGRRVLVGRPGLLADHGIDPAPLAPSIQRWSQRGHTAVAVDDQPAGVIALGDALRPDAADTLARLRDAGITPVLVTSDNTAAASHIAAQVGIGPGDVHAEVHPDRKAALVRDLQQRGRRVAMVGDGSNDAPALMQADVGIAIGSGTDIAIESADVILVRDRLHLLLVARQISHSSYRRITQNVGLAFAFNGIGIPAAATGLLSPVWAMIAMAASVTAIFVNSIGARPTLLFAAIGSVGRHRAPGGEPVREPHIHRPRPS